jgi:hypothetical protein
MTPCWINPNPVSSNVTFDSWCGMIEPRVVSIDCAFDLDPRLQACLAWAATIYQSKSA